MKRKVATKFLMNNGDCKTYHASTAICSLVGDIHHKGKVVIKFQDKIITKYQTIIILNY